MTSAIAAHGVEPQVLLQLHRVHRFGFWVAVKFSEEQKFEHSNLRAIFEFQLFFQNQNFKNKTIQYNEAILSALGFVQGLSKKEYLQA